MILLGPCNVGIVQPTPAGLRISSHTQWFYEASRAVFNKVSLDLHFLKNSFTYLLKNEGDVCRVTRNFVLTYCSWHFCGSIEC